MFFRIFPLLPHEFYRVVKFIFSFISTTRYIYFLSERVSIYFPSKDKRIFSHTSLLQQKRAAQSTVQLFLIPRNLSRFLSGGVRGLYFTGSIPNVNPPFTRSISSGRMSVYSPTIPKSAKWKIEAFGLWSIAMIFSDSFIPAMC